MVTATAKPARGCADRHRERWRGAAASCPNRTSAIPAWLSSAGAERVSSALAITLLPGRTLARGPEAGSTGGAREAGQALACSGLKDGWPGLQGLAELALPRHFPGSESLYQCGGSAADGRSVTLRYRSRAVWRLNNPQPAETARQ